MPFRMPMPWAATLDRYTWMLKWIFLLPAAAPSADSGCCRETPPGKRCWTFLTNLLQVKVVFMLMNYVVVCGEVRP